MLNLISNFEDIGYVHAQGTWYQNENLTYDIVAKICLLNGATFSGHLKASKLLLPRTNKLPIYLAMMDDYLIPLASPTGNDCVWYSANNYLTCYQNNGKNFIKFKDRSICEVSFSLFTIKKQYQKYLKLNEKILELKQGYDI